MLQRIIQILRPPDSGSEKGTLLNLANTMRNSNVKLDPLDDFQRCHEGFFHFFDSYAVAAILEELNLASLEDTTDIVPEDVRLSPLTVQRQWLLDSLQPVVEKFQVFGCLQRCLGNDAIIDTASATLKQKFNCRALGCSKAFVYLKARQNHEKNKHDMIPTADSSHASEQAELDAGEASGNGDAKYNYGRLMFSFGLLFTNCEDAVREGDGGRVAEMYKWWMLIFKAYGSTKYAYASLHLQFQLNSLLSAADAHRLIWNRTVNRSTRRGRRVSLDFHMENYVKLSKQALRHLGVNITQSSASTEVRALGTITELVESQNKDFKLKKKASYHKIHREQKDFSEALGVLLNCNLFQLMPLRKMSSFPGLEKQPLREVDIREFSVWIKEHTQKLMAEEKQRLHADF